MTDGQGLETFYERYLRSMFSSVLCEFNVLRI